MLYHSILIHIVLSLAGPAGQAASQPGRQALCVMFGLFYLNMNLNRLNVNLNPAGGQPVSQPASQPASKAARLAIQAGLPGWQREIDNRYLDR